MSGCLYDCFNRRVLTTTAYNLDGTGPAETTKTLHSVYAGQAAWQLIAEYAGVSASAAQLADHVYGLYIDELVQTRRDLDADGSLEKRSVAGAPSMARSSSPCTTTWLASMQ